MKVLIACEYSGKVRDAFINAGHDCISCDLLEGEGQYHKDHYKGDVFDIINNTRNYEAFKNIDLLIAFPPCTHLAVSGARYFEAKRKDGRQQEGIDFFMKLINAPIDKICVENPVPSKMAKLPKYDQIIQPYQFGHDYSKKTTGTMLLRKPAFGLRTCQNCNRLQSYRVKLLMVKHYGLTKRHQVRTS